MATKKLREFAATQASMNWVLTLGKQLTKSFKAFLKHSDMKDLNDFAGMNEVYGKYFKNETAPARSTLQVARIPKDSLVEIEVVAYV